MKFWPLLFLFGCAVEPLSQADIEINAQIELERAQDYVMWAKGCAAANGIIFTYNPWQVCRKRIINGRVYCIPHKSDWRSFQSYNNTRCVSRESVNEAFGL